MRDMKKFEVFYESTPNPQSLKFNVTAAIAEETVFFDDPVKSGRSPLAQKLFGFPWCSAVLVGPTFVAVTKQDWVDWSVIADPLSDLIAEHLDRGEGVLLPAEAFRAAGEAEADPTDADPNDSVVVRKIKEILNREIRPAVAMDGGDILFSHFENNRLYLRLQGACNGCPSSSMTLKDGVEARLKQDIPELLEVVAV